MTQHPDVIVVGGGAAGCSAALRLRQHGAIVTLIERSDYSQQRPGESLAPAAVGFLNQLGVRDRFDTECFQPTTGLLVSWGSADVSFSSFLTHPFGSGWNLDRVRFDRMLCRACRDHDVDVVVSRAPIRCIPDKDNWVLRIGNRSYSAPTIVDATGRASSLAMRMGGRRATFDRLIAIVTYHEEKNSDPRLVIESTPEGWWYSAGLPEDASVIAFLTDVDLVPRRPEHRRLHFMELLGKARYAHRGIDHTRSAFSTRLVCANTSRLIRPSSVDWFAVGDAALATSPLSGDGIARALESGLIAADAIVSTDTARCQRYNEWIEETWKTSTTRATQSYLRESRWTTPFWQRRHRHFLTANGPLEEQTSDASVSSPSRYIPGYRDPNNFPNRF